VLLTVALAHSELGMQADVAALVPLSPLPLPRTTPPTAPTAPPTGNASRATVVGLVAAAEAMTLSSQCSSGGDGRRALLVT